jgi:hypothetical protein
MRYAIFIVGLVLLAAGCISAPQENTPPAPQQNTTPPPPANTTPAAMSCNDYCITLPHAQCVGTWQISGTYPDCVCTYECVQNQTIPANASAPQPAAPEPVGTPTNKSVSDLLTDYMNNLRTGFYKSHDGMFNEKSFTWQRLAAPSGGITFDQGPATDLLFDGKSIDSVQASGFYVFTSSADSSQTTVGVAIFKAKTTPLDAYSGGDTYSVYYFPPSIGYNLTGCSTTTKDFEIDTQNDWYVSYMFSCDRAIAR